MRRLFFAGALAALLPAGTIAVAQEAVQGTVSTAAEASHVICTRECLLRSWDATIASATAGYVMLFAAAAAPADGAVTPQECVYIAGPGTVSMDYGRTGEPYKTGLTIVFSTTGCFTKTASASAFFKVRAQ